MKPTPKSPTDLAPLVAFGAHPDDIEFGSGGVIALETRASRPVHFIVCSRGESATHGSPAQRKQESEKSPPSWAQALNSSNLAATRTSRFAHLIPSSSREF